jgi:hypothetical protein
VDQRGVKDVGLLAFYQSLKTQERSSGRESLPRRDPELDHGDSACFKLCSDVRWCAYGVSRKGQAADDMLEPVKGRNDADQVHAFAANLQIRDDVKDLHDDLGASTRARLAGIGPKPFSRAVLTCVTHT